MSATDDGGGDEGWVARLSRLLGAREEDTHAALAARSAAGSGRNAPDTALLDAVISGMPDPVVVLDQDGRVILSDSIKASTGISDRATFVGQGFKFQIWEPDRFAVYRSEARNRLRETRIGQAPVHRAAGANARAE